MQVKRAESLRILVGCVRSSAEQPSIRVSFQPGRLAILIEVVLAAR